MLFHYQILMGSILVLITTAVHGMCTGVVVAHLRRRRSAYRELHSFWRRILLVSLVVLMLFLAALLEAAIWAATYIATGAISGVETALYFSLVTFTTLGYGDVVLHEGWRLLAAFQAATGIIVFGWTTALIFALVQHLAADAKPTD